MMGSGMGGGSGQKKAIQMDQNYNFPIIALKALTQYQPRDYQFAIEGRTLFDISQYPKGIKVLNGDISGCSKVSGQNTGGSAPVPESAFSVSHDSADYFRGGCV